MMGLISDKVRSILFRVVGVIFVLHLLYGAIFVLESTNQRSVHLSLGLILVFLAKPLYRQMKNIPRSLCDAIDIVCILGVLFTGFYMFLQAPDLAARQGLVYTGDYISFVLVLLLMLDATRRLMGWSLVILILACLLYIYSGPYMPGFLRHAGMSFERLTGFMYTNQIAGIYGSILGSSVSFIALFIIFGAVVVKSGVGEFFINVSNSLFGRYRGGPAKIAVFVSALFGTVNGTATANVATTGQFTIPTMKRIGYSSKFAGAVEAVASSGGQIMPPVMGVGAFLMADMLGMSYSDIIVAAAIPAIVYFCAVLFGVDLEAARLNLRGLPKSEITPIWQVLKTQFIQIIPILVLIYLFVIRGMSPGQAAFWSILTAIAVSWLTKAYRMGWKRIVEAFEEGAETAMLIVVLCGSAGIIIGTFGVSGLALKLTSGLIELSGQNLLLLLIFAMCASIILGMGMPTATAYILVAILVAPAMVQLGVEPIAAHMFVFYFAVFSAITPPVALAAFAASSIAKEKPFAIAVSSLKLALAAFLMPYAFVYGNELLMMSDSPMQIILSTISALIGSYLLAIAVIGYWKSRVHPLVRLLFFAAAVLTIIPGYATDLIGILIAVLLMALMYVRTRNAKQVQHPEMSGDV